MTTMRSNIGVAAWLLRVAMVLALVMLGVAIPQGAARASGHEMHGVTAARAEMPMGHTMADHAPGMEGAISSGKAHGGHSLACAIACVGGAMPAAGLLAPASFQLVSTVWVEAAGTIPIGCCPAPTAHPPKTI